MSQNPHRNSDHSEHNPTTRERRLPTATTKLPVTALGDDLDPAREIRALVEHLQVGVRDARNRGRVAEKEKDDLAAQLENAISQIEQLRAKERESRTHSVEIPSLIHERDAALQEAERHRKAAIESQRKMEAINRERSEAQRQRDDSVKRQADTTRAAHETVAQLSEIQKQLIGLRQARDSATGLNLELSSKISRVEDEVAESGYKREAAEKNQKKLEYELSELRRQCGTVTADRDATAQQVKDLHNQLDDARKKLLDFTTEKSAVLDDTHHAAALAEARQQLNDVIAERDSARLRSQEQATEIETLHSELTEICAQQASLSVTPEELEDLRKQNSVLATERDRHEICKQQLTAEAFVQEERLAELTAAMRREREEALHCLELAQQQTEAAIRARDTEREEHTEAALAADTQLASVRAHVAELEKRLEGANSRIAELSSNQQDAKVISGRFEKQRVATIDLGARLTTAQREILELSASLAEARLAARFANSRAAKEACDAFKREVSNDLGPGDHGWESADSDAATSHRASPLAPDCNEVFDEKVAKAALATMKKCFESFQQNPSELSLLQVLHSHAFGFSERARAGGYIAPHRLCSACALLVEDLYRFPEMVNLSTMRTIRQTIDFLITLMKDRNVAQIEDPTKALIYVVDDDPENCETIKITMETAMLRTSCAQEPAVALAELSARRVDLIFLDVNLPGMDGFELCSHIRQLPHHARTPIIFLTGLSTLENRVQSSLSGGSDFVGKPFNLHELTAKALTFILRAKLLMD